MKGLSKDLHYVKTGFDSLDREHEVFVGIFNRVVHAYEAGREISVKEGLLAELFKFIDFHFTSEENLMLLARDPNYQRHKEDHQRMFEQLRSIIGVYDVEQLDLNDLLDFVNNWMKGHAQMLDAEFGEFLRAQHFNGF